jgi:hypothetical protein
MGARLLPQQNPKVALPFASHRDGACAMEDPIEQSERHVREDENRVAEQVHRLTEIERRNDPYELVAKARLVLETLKQTLQAARDHLQDRRRRHGSE